MRCSNEINIQSYALGKIQMTEPPGLPDNLAQVVKFALNEDIGDGDVTSAHMPHNETAAAQVVCRENAILCGIPWFNEVFDMIDDSVSIEWNADEGDRIGAGNVICRLSGKAGVLLQGERTALNFLQTLSGTATTTREFVDAVAGTGARILDTRKTIPGLRSAQKYAIRIGGGTNHRQGLYDGVIIKENHQIGSSSASQIINALRPNLPKDFLVEIEVEDIEMLTSAIESGANRIMLDNFSISQIAEAVRITDRRIELEASGSFTLDNVRAAAETGVEFISIGALTKHVRAIDLSMRFAEPP